MRKFILLVAAIFVFGLPQSYALNIEDFITFERVDPLKKVFREENFFPEFKGAVHVARGEYATFQFAVRSALPLKELKLSVTPFSNDKGKAFTASRVGFVDYVKINRLIPKPSTDVLHSPSGYFPDPIREVESWSVGRDQAQPMWITVPIPAKTKAGIYKAEVTLTGKASGEEFTLKKSISIKVYPVTLEKPTLWLSNWFNTSDAAMKVLNGGKSVKRYSPEYWDMVSEIARMLGECHTNVILLDPLRHVEYTMKGDKYSFDFGNFDKFIEIFEKAGVLGMVEGEHIAIRKGGWKSQFVFLVPEYNEDGVKKKIKHDLDSEVATNFYKQYLPALKSHLKRKGLENRYAQHIADEPTSSNYKSYIEIAKFVKEIWPEVKIIEACHTTNLENTVDIWVPHLARFKKDYKFYKARKNAGDDVWFYTCLSPQGEYANRFVELPLLKTRILHWLNYRYGATGYLHWGFNQWGNGCNPYGDISSIQSEFGTVLPGGDSWIVYPDNGKLYSSIRMEAMRDGVADYTLLQMLDKKNPKQAKEYCRRVVYHWTAYDTSNDHFRWTRKKILELLSK